MLRVALEVDLLEVGDDLGESLWSSEPLDPERFVAAYRDGCVDDDVERFRQLEHEARCASGVASDGDGDGRQL